MDTAFHDNNQRSALEINAARRVPRSIFAIILLLFAGLYWFAAYGDTPAPEKTVKDFYQGYFDRDFDKVAQNLSVFWSVRFLSDEYASMKPAELLADRSKIEKEISAVIADFEKDNEIPKDIKVKVMRDYTKIGKESAVVVYSFIENGKETSMEAAILILEKGKFRILNMSPVDETYLEDIKKIDINILDNNVAELLGSPSAE